MPVDNQQEQAFLEDQLAQMVRIVARLQNAFDACQSPLERQGLQSMIKDAEAHRDQLQSMLTECASGAAVSLEGIVLYRLKQLQDQSRRQAQNWCRGRPTPPEYWAIEARRGALVDLLNRYRIWRNHHGDSVGFQIAPWS